MKKLIYDRDVKFGAGPIALPPAHGELNENLIVWVQYCVSLIYDKIVRKLKIPVPFFSQKTGSHPQRPRKEGKND